MPAKVLIADDHPLLRHGVHTYLDGELDIKVVGEARNGDEVLPQVEKFQPDVILLDMDMPGMSALEIVQAVSSLETPTEVLVFSGHKDHENKVEVIKCGARDYLLKGCSPQVLVERIRAVANKEAFSGQGVSEDLVDETPQSTGLFLEELSARELQVLELVARGFSNKKIAQTLFITESTVRFHMQRIFEKSAVNNRTEAAVMASRMGWLNL